MTREPWYVPSLLGKESRPLPFEQAGQAVGDQGQGRSSWIHWTGGLVNLGQVSWQCHDTYHVSIC